MPEPTDRLHPEKPSSPRSSLIAELCQLYLPDQCFSPTIKHSLSIGEVARQKEGFAVMHTEKAYDEDSVKLCVRQTVIGTVVQEG